MLSLYHFVVASCRNATSFYPPRPVRAYLHYLLASLGLAAICMLSAVVAGLPLFGVLVSGIAEGEANAGLAFLLILLSVLLMVLGGLIPLLRLGFVLVALAIGDKYDYGRVWRMTKGYTLKMLCAIFLGMLPALATGFVWWLVDKASVDSLAFQLMDALLTFTCIIFLSVFWAVLYQELTLREREPEKTGTKFDFDEE